jgi:hypothetical protein
MGGAFGGRAFRFASCSTLTQEQKALPQSAAVLSASVVKKPFNKCQTKVRKN